MQGFFRSPWINSEIFKNNSEMNKFILVPKEQFENLRENQISETGTDSKNESALEEKNSEEGQKIIKNQDTSTKGDKIIKGQDPPPGLPNHYLEVDKKKNFKI